MLRRLQFPLPPPVSSTSPRPLQTPKPVSLHLRPPKGRKCSLPPSLFPSNSSDAGLLFREKLLYLERDLCVDPAAALAANPALRAAPLASLRALSALLHSRGLTSADACRALSMYPALLTDDPRDGLLPALDFLLGPAAIPPGDLPVAVRRCPRLLASSVPSQLRPALYFLRRLGFARITARTALLLVSSVEHTLIPKLHFFQNLGFSYLDTKKMVLRSPGLLTFSIDKNFEPKVEFLTREMHRDVKELKEFPQYFAFSLEGKIKPRHRMLVESGLEMALAEMLRPSDGEFREQLLELRLRSLDSGKL